MVSSAFVAKIGNHGIPPIGSAAARSNSERSPLSLTAKETVGVSQDDAVRRFTRATELLMLGAERRAEATQQGRLA